MTVEAALRRPEAARPPARAPRRAGFTLVELMIVVTILGILAAVAVPSYISYVYKSKTAEAVGFLGEIKARQESYRSDFGQYVDISTYMPSATPTRIMQAWPADVGDSWRALGAVPPGRQTYFSYRTVAGLPGTTPAATAIGGDRGYGDTDFWFISQALGDLDGDGTRVTFESYSHGQGLWISAADGWE
jgi:prepilin-type N-terminal cleavage/methylation domain-containing protein